MRTFRGRLWWPRHWNCFSSSRYDGCPVRRSRWRDWLWLLHLDRWFSALHGDHGRLTSAACIERANDADADRQLLRLSTVLRLSQRLLRVRQACMARRTQRQSPRVLLAALTMATEHAYDIHVTGTSFQLPGMTI